MYKMIFLSFLICLLSCSQSSKNEYESKEKDVKNDKSEIVFIFKNQNIDEFSDNNISIVGSPIYYSEKNDFTIIELMPNNKLTNDTIIKNVISDKICLSHTYNKTQKFLYEFHKGDTVVFDYKKGHPFVSILNRKTLKFDNNFLADIRIERPLEDFQFFIKNKRRRNKIEDEMYLKELNAYRIKIDKSLDSLLDINQISKSNYEMYKAANKFFEINTNKSLIKSVTIDDLKRDDILYLKTYRHFLNNYVVYRFKLKTQFDNDPMSCNSKVAFDSIAKSSLFSNRVKASLLYAHLINIAEKNSNVDLNSYFNKFQEIVNEPILNEKIRNNYLLDFVSLKKEVRDVYLTTLNKEKITLSNLVSKNKGKVIFVDFWASWCAPCRYAMPFSRELREEYKGNEIVFIYISIDTDFEKWMNASDKEKLFDNRNNLLSINYPTADFYKKLQIQTIPRYLIYNKNGELVHKNAPSPESKEIREELNRLLSE